MRFLLLLALSGMVLAEPFQIVFLRPDPARKPLSKEDGERIQAAHMANIQSLVKRGLLVAAGPFDDKVHTISGIFFFKMATGEEALREAAKDPTVVEHRNTVDVLTWQGPAGLGEEYKRLHAQDPKTPEDMGVHPFVLLHREKPGTMGLEHAAYIAELKHSGKLAAAGAVTGDKTVTEVLIFERISDEEAANLVAADPAVRGGIMRPEPHRWWSAAHVLPR